LADVLSEKGGSRESRVQAVAAEFVWGVAVRKRRGRGRENGFGALTFGWRKRIGKDP